MIVWICVGFAAAVEISCGLHNLRTILRIITNFTHHIYIYHQTSQATYHSPEVIHGGGIPPPAMMLRAHTSKETLIQHNVKSTLFIVLY